MSRRAFENVPATTVLLACLLGACQPTIELSGTYTPFDYPWSGLAKIKISTPFPAPWFIGTFTFYDYLKYTEVRIAGPVNEQNEIRFLVLCGDPPIGGLCTCQGFDDGSSIFPGSGEIAGDSLGDRLSCPTWLGEPFQPPAEVFRTDGAQCDNRFLSRPGIQILQHGNPVAGGFSFESSLLVLAGTETNEEAEQNERSQGVPLHVLPPMRSTSYNDFCKEFKEEMRLLSSILDHLLGSRGIGTVQKTHRD